MFESLYVPLYIEIFGLYPDWVPEERKKDDIWVTEALKELKREQLWLMHTNKLT